VRDRPIVRSEQHSLKESSDASRTLVALFAVSILVALPVVAGHGWGSYHWPRSGAEASIPIYRSLTVTTYSNWPDHLQKSVFGDPANPNTANRRGWNNSSVLALSITASATDSTTRYNCTAPTRAVRVCNYAYGSNGWAGLAQIWPDSAGHIQRANAKMNDTYMGSSSNNPWRRHVMCQEVGHDGVSATRPNGSSQNLHGLLPQRQRLDAVQSARLRPARRQHHDDDPGAPDVLANSLRDPGPLAEIDMNEMWN
jgi:hypothetical protein